LIIWYDILQIINGLIAQFQYRWTPFRVSDVGMLIKVSITAVLACLLSVPAFAQVNLNNESERQLQLLEQRQRLREEQLRATPDVRLDLPASVTLDIIPMDESPCFIIHTITLEEADGSKPASPFTQALKETLNTRSNPESPTGLLGHCFGAQGINVIMRRLQNNIIKRGYVTTRIVAGPQALKTGVLKLTVISGSIGDIELRSSKGSRPPLKALLPFKKGDLLNLRNIEQALEDLKRLPSVTVDIKVVPTEGEDAAAGQSDLVIIWEQNRPWRAGIAVDNSGSESTGVYQSTVSLAYDNALRLNDTLSLNFGNDLGGARPGSGGSHSFSWNYSFPVGLWRFSLNGNRFDFFQTIDGAFEDLRFTGSSRSYIGGVSRLLYRNSVRKIDVGVDVWTRKSNNFIEDVEILTQRRRTGGYELRTNYREFIGRSTVSGSASYRRGTGLGNALEAPEELSGEGSARAAIIKANLHWTTPFQVANQSLRYSTQFRGQWNRDPLTAQDRFSLGSNLTVRGTDGEITLSGERGWLLRNDIEIKTPFSNQWAYVGLDYGYVNSSTNELPRDWLAGSALGVRGFYSSISYDASIVAPTNAPEGFGIRRPSIFFSLAWQY
jgi:hemolysin activation/secretion protein